MRLRTPWLPIILFALAGCGNGEEYPEAPQIFTDRAEMGFNTEFNGGTFVGATAYNSLIIENRGLNTLELTEFTLSGPPVFTLTPPEGFEPGTPLRLETNKTAFVQVTFKPTDDVEYTGTLTIKSNAANEPVKEIVLRGKGVNP